MTFKESFPQFSFEQTINWVKKLEGPEHPNISVALIPDRFVENNIKNFNETWKQANSKLFEDRYKRYIPPQL